jgi:hypothetical protein
MLHCIVGTDYFKIEKELTSLRERYSKRLVHAFSQTEVGLQEIQEALFSQSFFDEEKLFIISDIEAQDIETLLPEMVTQAIIFKIPKLLKKEREFLDSRQVKIHEVKNDREVVEVFELSDALFAWDKKRAWLALTRLRETNDIEPIFGTYLWALKTICISQGDDAKTLSPFVLSKLKGIGKKVSVEDIRRLWYEALCAYQSARRGEGELAWLLERQLLAMK